MGLKFGVVERLGRKFAQGRVQLGQRTTVGLELAQATLVHGREHIGVPHLGADLPEHTWQLIDHVEPVVLLVMSEP